MDCCCCDCSEFSWMCHESNSISWLHLFPVRLLCPGEIIAVVLGTHCRTCSSVVHCSTGLKYLEQCIGFSVELEACEAVLKWSFHFSLHLDLFRLMLKWREWQGKFLHPDFIPQRLPYMSISSKIPPGRVGVVLDEWLIVLQFFFLIKYVKYTKYKVQHFTDKVLILKQIMFFVIELKTFFFLFFFVSL